MCATCIVQRSKHIVSFPLVFSFLFYFVHFFLCVRPQRESLDFYLLSQCICAHRVFSSDYSFSWLHMGDNRREKFNTHNRCSSDLAIYWVFSFTFFFFRQLIARVHQQHRCRSASVGLLAHWTPWGGMNIIDTIIATFGMTPKVCYLFRRRNAITINYTAKSPVAVIIIVIILRKKKKRKCKQIELSTVDVAFLFITPIISKWFYESNKRKWKYMLVRLLLQWQQQQQRMKNTLTQLFIIINNAIMEKRHHDASGEQTWTSWRQAA